MNIQIHFKTGKSIVINNIDIEFKLFVSQFYTHDVKIYDEVAINVHEVEFIEVLK